MFCSQCKIICRSMGILLPPVPQATVTTLTLHHRNRSLDSALQRIPEVDVTPSPECETAPDSSDKVTTPSIKSRNREREDLASLGSDDSGILCGSDSGSSDAANVTTRESSVDHLHSRESLDSSSQAGDMDCVDVVDVDESVGSISPVNIVINDHLSNEIDKCMDINVVVPEINKIIIDNVECIENKQPLLLNGNTDCCLSSSREHHHITNVAATTTNGDCTVKELRDEQPTGNNVSVYHNAMELAIQRELAGAAMTLCCGVTQHHDTDDTSKKAFEIKRQEIQPKPTEGCLLRLFESQIFDMSMAISYLFNSKEPGVQSYLGENIF